MKCMYIVKQLRREELDNNIYFIIYFYCFVFEIDRNEKCENNISITFYKNVFLRNIKVYNNKI